MKEVKYFSLLYRYLPTNTDDGLSEECYFFDFHVLNKKSYSDLSKLDFSVPVSIINDYEYSYAFSLLEVLKDFSLCPFAISDDINFIGIVVPARRKINVSYSLNYMGNGLYNMIIFCEFTDNLKFSDD